MGSEKIKVSYFTALKVISKWCFVVLLYFSIDSFFKKYIYIIVTKMVLMSVLNDALRSIYNAEQRGKRQVLLRPSSKVVIKFLSVMMKHGNIYIYIYIYLYTHVHTHTHIYIYINYYFHFLSYYF